MSTDQQNLALQLDAFEQAGCRRVFRDVGSGSLKHRPQFDERLSFHIFGALAQFEREIIRERTRAGVSQPPANAAASAAALTSDKIAAAQTMRQDMSMPAIAKVLGVPLPPPDAEPRGVQPGGVAATIGSRLTEVQQVATVECYMPTPTTTFRLGDRDRRKLDQLANELVCSRTDVLRLGMAALARDPELRSRIKAENVARAFLKSLRTQYGERAVLELIDGPDDPKWKLAGEPIDREVLDLDVRRVEDRIVLSLIDPSSGVGISNVMVWTDENEMRHAVIPLDQLWVYATGGVVAEPATRQLYDGRPVVQIAEDDGSVKHIVLDHNGNSHVLDPGEVPAAAFNC